MEMVTLNNHSRESLQQHLEETTQEDMFFRMCALRVKKIDQRLKMVLQLQITNLIMNAETPHLTPWEIPPLPTIQNLSSRRSQQPQQPQQQQQQLQQPQQSQQHQGYYDNMQMHNRYDAGSLISQSLDISNSLDISAHNNSIHE